MILTLDTIGERYSLLPSEVLSRGSTLDLYIMDAAISYHNHQHRKSQNQLDPNPTYSHSEMLDMIKKARE